MNDLVERLAAQWKREGWNEAAAHKRLSEMIANDERFDARDRVALACLLKSPTSKLLSRALDHLEIALGGEPNQAQYASASAFLNEACTALKGIT